MTADLATNFENLPPAASLGQTDPVRARVKYQQPLTNYEKLHPVDIHPPLVPRKPVPTDAPHPRRLFLVPNKRMPRPGVPHPGDIAYWVTCFGGAGLLLLAATHY